MSKRVTIVWLETSVACEEDINYQQFHCFQVHYKRRLLSYASTFYVEFLYYFGYLLTLIDTILLLYDPICFS